MEIVLYIYILISGSGVPSPWMFMFPECLWLGHQQIENGQSHDLEKAQKKKKKKRKSPGFPIQIMY